LFMLTKSYFYSVKLLRMYKKHLLFLLFTSLFAWKSNAQNASANINDLIQKSFTAMANVKTMTYHFYASERMDDGTYSKSDVEFKVVASPLKIFANAHEPQSAKLSYDASKSKDVKVKKGLSLSLSPTNKLLMKGVHNPITRAGFGRIKMILEKSLAQRKGQDLSKYVKLAGTVMYDNKECLKVVISDPDYKIIDYTVKPGQDFDSSKLDPAVAKGIAAAPQPAQEKISVWMKEGIVAGDFKVENGWAYTTKAGVYGTEYRQRAAITWYGLGANRPQDAIYPISEGPDLLKKYSGEHKYVMHLNKGEMPPVNGFWSLTMYDAQFFFVDNPLNRYTLSQRNKFKTNADGSIDLYIQHESPGKNKEANWLPAPEGEFVLTLRLYWPKETAPSLIDGSWKIPEVKEVD